MKKLLLTLFLVVATVTAYAEIGPDNRSVSLDNLGNLQSGSLDKYYIKVKNSDGGALSDGDVVILDVADDDGYGVKGSTTAGDVPHCVLDEDCADGELCLCQTYGYKNTVNFDNENGNSVAGDFAFISENTKGSVEAEASPAATDIPIGVFYDADTATGDIELFIRLR